ncbi:MAG TPA: hypothetical protein DCF33_14260, partial [Saprospirales bacterium]|nr:hypothetical protein [Saprospirales bacterium]
MHDTCLKVGRAVFAGMIYGHKFYKRLFARIEKIHQTSNFRARLVSSLPKFLLHCTPQTQLFCLMRIDFPEGFIWGTSTAAAQVETAGQHPWRGLKALDGAVFERTTDHELRRESDAALIAQFGSVYRCGVDWSRIQPEPQGKFVPEVVEEYRRFFEDLRARGVSIMFVLHHFAHPNWFEKMGGWTNEDNIPYYLEYTRLCVKHFGEYVSYWNTF